eukprot:TRINITY_DN29056_c0_g1_i1.p1 TRINITY_DN29056_c0_g1~~TRINITY_DN29056_c0_g1_i1.p1  ORF type:complete len:816 (-),score=208.45 TRINITY_DN29056_c0_g1_i1:178-2625(-)
MVSKAAVIGIDLGSSDSYVAYVGKGVVDVVQNEVSKRQTSTLVGFTQRERLLGDAALAQVKSNAKNTCRNFKHVLGHSADEAQVEQEHFWSTCPIEDQDSENGRLVGGFSVTYQSQRRWFSAQEVAAMFLTKLREIAETWCQSKVADVVIGVPAYYGHAQRQALLEAARIANVSVLSLMNEHTATALAYGIYRTNDFDAEKPCIVAFCSMGHVVFSVSIVQFWKGKLSVLCEASEKIGGRDMDECLIRAFADQFEKKTGLRVLESKKAILKLEDAVTKTKKILSANNEADLVCECLMEDEDFASKITRESFEAMCEPLMSRLQAVLERAKAQSGLGVEQVDFVEMVGGASRVPWVKALCSQAFGGKDLSTTMNADESVARGCALQAAILSPLYKVREFSVEEFLPATVRVVWMNDATVTEPDCVAEDGSSAVEELSDESAHRAAVVFPAGAQLGHCRTVSFWRLGTFEFCTQRLDKDGTVIEELASYCVHLAPQEQAQKVLVSFQLTLHGTVEMTGVQVETVETYAETVREQQEVPVPPTEEATAEPAEASQEGGQDAAAPRPPPASNLQWVDVTVEKSRTVLADVNFTCSAKHGFSEEELQAKSAAEDAMQADMREIIDTDEKRNDLEGYIFNMRANLQREGIYGPFASASDREKFNTELTKAEDWLLDCYDASKAEYVDKLLFLKKTGDEIARRYTEAQHRDEWISSLSGSIAKYRGIAQRPCDKYEHILPARLSEIENLCGQAQSWLDEMRGQQDRLTKMERPVLECNMLQTQLEALTRDVEQIMKDPKVALPTGPVPEEDKENHPQRGCAN